MKTSLATLSASCRWRAWECAFVLIDEHRLQLTDDQSITCHVALMGEPEQAPLALIAIAAQVIGERT